MPVGIDPGGTKQADSSGARGAAWLWQDNLTD